MNDDKEHPLEGLFGIEAGSTPVFGDLPGRDITRLNERAQNLVDPATGELVPRKVDQVTDAELEKEERIEDLHIDAQLETVHNAAMIAYEQQIRMSQEVDPKFAARNAEVAAQYLGIALNAVNSRVDTKFKRQKIKIAKIGAGTPQTVNQNVIVADRNDILKAIMGGNKPAKDILEEK